MSMQHDDTAARVAGIRARLAAVRARLAAADADPISAPSPNSKVYKPAEARADLAALCDAVEALTEQRDAAIKAGVRRGMSISLLCDLIRQMRTTPEIRGRVVEILNRDIDNADPLALALTERDAAIARAEKAEAEVRHTAQVLNALVDEARGAQQAAEEEAARYKAAIEAHRNSVKAWLSPTPGEDDRALWAALDTPSPSGAPSLPDAASAPRADADGGC